MRIVEQRHLNEPWLLWKLGNLTAIDDSYIKSVGIALLFKDPKWDFKPLVTGNDSLFYNALLFLRLSLPFGLFFGFRWSPATDKKALFQCGIGWKLNGRLAVLFRIQSDESAAAGETGANTGQATGFNYGTH